MDKGVVYVKIIGTYDVVASPGFSSARMMGEIDWIRMKREKEIILRKDKINKIKNEINQKQI